MGEYVLPIPGDAILTYCNTFGWDRVDRYTLITVLKAMDLAYCEHYNKKGKGKLNARKKKVVS